ncbi:GTP pyrophosphokinase [Desulfogranum japonicum]|uniref:GTP pyrophosphokinase n=1 Tax=Desulfogranum japonicum TaxID=231447 RepID=UPI00040BBB55|nr:RelA/SpoT domain-containing protein [Desulfogranum japonicum]
MRKREKEALLIAFLKEKIKYEKLGDYILHLIQDDPSAPKNNFHTITYRIKEKQRFIQKIEQENKKLTHGEPPITVKNFKERMGDLLGIRLICLRLDDIKILEAYFHYLAEEDIFRFIKQPKQKRSFILPVDPGEENGCHDLRYGGYSSIHYQIALSESLAVPDEIKGLQVELQLRTILEEAWGEIDHKYRYAHTRSGTALPEFIHSGFYNLSAYLQAAAMQAEYLCRQVEMYSSDNRETHRDPDFLPFPGADKHKQDVAKSLSASLPIVQQNLADIFGFKLQERTLTYILKRFQEAGVQGQHKKTMDKILHHKRVEQFKTVFHEILTHKPFEDKNKRNIDVINAVNFALFHETQGPRLAIEGLRSILKHRKERSGW